MYIQPSGDAARSLDASFNGEETMELAANQVCALVIDDHAEVRDLLATILLEDGHVVITASSAEEGLSYLPHHTFQVAFLDQELPGLEGFELGEYLRRNNPYMQIALVTASVDESLERMAREHDIDFIQKPFTLGEIQGQVMAYLEQRAERASERERQQDPECHPPIARYIDEVAAFYDMPAVPRRLEEQLERKLREAMHGLSSHKRYTERDRVLALAGLLAARVLGLGSVKAAGDVLAEQEYDRVMRERGREVAFDGTNESS